jgi:hypothetical protein
MKITFTEEDRKLANYLAEMRDKPKRQKMIKSGKVAVDRTNHSIDYLGVLAEIGISKAMNISPPSPEILLGGDDGWDFKVNGKKIEVKYTFHPNGRLLIHDKSMLKSDYYILLTGDDKEMRIAGWTDKDTFAKKGYLRDLGYGENFVMDQGQLFPFNKFKAAL